MSTDDLRVQAWSIQGTPETSRVFHVVALDADGDPYSLVDHPLGATIGGVAQTVDDVVGNTASLTMSFPAGMVSLPLRLTIDGGEMARGKYIPRQLGSEDPDTDLTLHIDPVFLSLTVVGGGGAIDSVNGQTGVVVLDAGDVGADPAGTAAGLIATEAGTRAAADTVLDGRLDAIEAISIATDAELAAAVAAEAALARDATNLTGGTVNINRLPATVATDTEVTNAVSAEVIARNAAIAQAIADLIGSAPGLLDTLQEIADALGDDPNFAATMATALAGKQPLNANLTAVAALSTTNYGRSVLELANAAAGRTLLGLVIGTDVQAFSAVLAATTASFQTADETKLDGIATGATANQADAVLLARANHTGTQAISTVTGLQTALNLVTADPLTSGLPAYVFGHSWAASDTYNTVGNRWWEQLRRRLGLGNIANRSVAGSTSHTITSVALGGGSLGLASAWTVGTKGLVLVHVGGNEQVNTDATVASVAAMLQMELKSLVAYLGADGTSIVQGAAMTAVGTWTNFGSVIASAGNYSYTTTANDTLTGTISGDRINLHYMTFDGVLFHGRVFEVRVDGVLKATVDPESMVSVATWGSNHGGVGHGVLELTGLGAGSHSVEVKATATLGGGSGTPAYVGVDCLTTPSTTPPLVTLVVDPRITSYASAAERLAILTQAQAVASGRANVTIADIDIGWAGNTWLGADNIHPLDVGEAHVSTRITEALLDYVTAGGTVPWGATAASTLAPVDLPVVDGGTGASTAPAALTNLGAAPLASVRTSIWLPFTSFGTASGSPGQSIVGFLWRAWALDQTTQESVSATVQGRDFNGWATYDVVALFANAGAGSGAVVSQVDISTKATGDTFNNPSSGTLRTSTVAAQDVAYEVTMETGVAVPTSSQYVGFRVVRVAANAGDTLANDVNFFGLRLNKAS